MRAATKGHYAYYDVEDNQAESRQAVVAHDLTLAQARLITAALNQYLQPL